MSELSLGTLSGLAANSYVIDVAAGSTLDLSAGAVLPTGSILQVVSTTKTDTYSESLASGAFSATVPGLTATITPRSTSSKILVMLNVTGSQTADFGVAGGRLVRDGTPIAVGDTAGSRNSLTMYSRNTTANTYGVLNASTEFLDSPNTTSSVTYGLQMFNAGGSTLTTHINRSNGDASVVQSSRSVSTITLMEVAG